MSPFLKKLFLLGIVFSFVLYTWFVLNGELHFSSDIARDFFLLNEISQKKLILIGPKSSVMGLFHGPLWLYLNYPAYLIGGGNPITVAWYWIILTGLFIYSCYFVGKKLFNEHAGYLFALMTSLYMFFHIDEYFNPIGAMFLIPINFYLIVMYLRKYQLKYLILYVIISGFIIQLELAIGIPLFALSIFLLLFKLLKSNRKKHLWAIFLIALPLSNFILFDLRHEFLITNSVLRYLSPESGDAVKYNYLYMFYDRAKLMIINVEILRFDPLYRNTITGVIFIFFLILQIKDNKYRSIYFLFLYFYVGFFVMSLINKGPILYFYFFPFFPFVFLIFSSFITSRYKNIFLIIFFIIYLLNLYSVYDDITSSKRSIGVSETSWKFLNTMANNVYSGNEKSFGYFVYTPDVIGYGPKYALKYEQTVHKDKEAFYFQKKPITYIIVAPPAENNPYLSYEWWKTQRVMIDKKPVSSTTFKNGYRIEKYELTDDEVKIPFDPGIDPGLSFR